MSPSTALPDDIFKSRYQAFRRVHIASPASGLGHGSLVWNPPEVALGGPKADAEAGRMMHLDANYTLLHDAYTWAHDAHDTTLQASGDAP